MLKTKPKVGFSLPFPLPGVYVWLENIFRRRIDNADIYVWRGDVAQGYSADNPNILLLRLRNFTIGKNLADEEILGPGALVKIADMIGVLTPFVWKYFLFLFISPPPPTTPPDDSTGGGGGLIFMVFFFPSFSFSYRFLGDVPQ